MKIQLLPTLIIAFAISISCVSTRQAIIATDGEQAYHPVTTAFVSGITDGMSQAELARRVFAIDYHVLVSIVRAPERVITESGAPYEKPFAKAVCVMVNYERESFGDTTDAIWLVIGEDERVQDAWVNVVDTSVMTDPGDIQLPIERLPESD